ncbi:MarR family winged helix-turn-helix transcriptional regulator [Piscinibacter sakaiensis]|uniref:MarR family winged helix-turn-helix transcriptional regulator n=1 Tax=Piscinibacter sakaiensis TaxID=1547922 RepID=UPI003AABA84F
MATTTHSSKKAPARGDGAASLRQINAHAPESLVTYRVSVLAQVLGRLVDASVKQNLGLTARQWRVLVILNRIGTSPSGEVARMASFDHSQVSRVALELAQKGLITQENDPADRRRQILALTPAGVECLKTGVPASLERQSRFLARLTPDEYKTFCRVLDVIEDEAHQLLREMKADGVVPR